MGKPKKVLIVGGGLVGALLAILLARRGYQIDVREYRDDIRKSHSDGGRSINLALSERGWLALKKAGIDQSIRAIALPMFGRELHARDGSQTFQPYGGKDQAIYSVSRRSLNAELLSIAERFSNVSLRVNQKCLDLNLDRASARFLNTCTGAVTQVEADLIFGADGAYSTVRAGMMKKMRLNFSQHYLEYGYKELHIPAGPDGKHQMNPRALHIWPRGKYMLIALPNSDGSFTATLFLPYEGRESFERLQTDRQILDFFREQFADTMPLINNLVAEFRGNPTSSLFTIRCNPWHYGDRVLLLGDAAHAILPFYGQGMNAGFEDCRILDGLIEKEEEDWGAILHEFGEQRISDTDAIAELAFQNFVEMRDLVADPAFLIRKKIEAYFHERFPSRFTSPYAMVSFSNLPYRQALAERLKQDELFREIRLSGALAEDWQSNPRVEEIFFRWLKGNAQPAPLNGSLIV